MDWLSGVKYAVNVCACWAIISTLFMGQTKPGNESENSRWSLNLVM